ncbi:MAG: class I SAM-dependent RNA methyltransferase [Crocinitomicaceae bacterium]|jgi:putative N6-adenine-specific DNA methylase|nr:class I SAM-dependent RNA methyltransferase [Crocinitomicaceae bacterium]MBT6514535.1 class I SAM-dependent RNA methyltransferase [Crocinitomicaceae bacterium]
MSKQKLIAKTFAGLEDILAKELKAVGAENIKIMRRAVQFEGDSEVMYRANFQCRTALAILVEISKFYAKSTDDLYRKSKEINWSEYLLMDQTFSIHATTYSDVFSHSKYASLKVKDAIADFFRDIYGQRPNVNTDRPDVKIEVHISNNSVTLLLNSSGEALFKRGYRDRTGLAPMNECLAAGIVQLAQYNPEEPLVDFACGAGTILFEACLIAKNVAPGLLNRKYGFQRWINYNEKLFNQIVEEAKSAVNNVAINIKGYDIDRKMILFCRHNKANADYFEDIRFYQTDLRDVETEKKSGLIIANLPFDERLQVGNINALYEDIGSSMKHHFPGFRAFLFSSNMDALKCIGLKPKVKIPLYSGGMKASLRRYDLYAGTKKANKQ